MPHKLKYNGAAVSIPVDLLKHLAEASNNQSIKNICTMLEYGLSYKPFEDVAYELIQDQIMTKEETDVVKAYMCGAGMLEIDNKTRKRSSHIPAKKAPVLQTGKETEALTSTDIKDWIDNTAHMSEFIKACEDVYGSPFNRTELQTILTYSHEYRMKDECILSILGYSKEKDHTIAYTKEIFNRMIDNGLTSLAEVNAELAFLGSHSSYVSVVKQIFGITRALTSAEKPKIERWNKEYKFNRELIQLAFDKAAAKEKASIAYCDKMLTGWYAEGLKDADAVKAKYAHKGNIKKEDGSTFNVDDFFEAAIKRSYAEFKNE